VSGWKGQKKFKITLLYTVGIIEEIMGYFCGNLEKVGKIPRFAIDDYTRDEMGISGNFGSKVLRRKI